MNQLQISDKQQHKELIIDRKFSTTMAGSASSKLAHLAWADA
jgi:hypothetical protein